MKNSIGDLAEAVLAEVAQEQLVKKAALSHIHVDSDLSQLMVKVASRIREEAANPEITYADLERFRKNNAV